jgi:uncharacterized protein
VSSNVEHGDRLPTISEDLTDSLNQQEIPQDSTDLIMTRNQLPDLSALDSSSISQSLFANGWAHVPRLVNVSACRSLIKLYDQDRYFRSRIDMARYHFGQGTYAYFADPLPAVVAHLRTHLYTHLAPIANHMMELMKQPQRYPPTHGAFQKECVRQGQTKPTPLLLRYEAGGFNCLHRDIYGPTLFPLQAMVMLRQPGQDFGGGEFLLVENRPRQQARGMVFKPDLGDLMIFPVSDRPVQGKRGMLRASMRHGVSPVTSGQRWALGIIFHDAK